MLRQEMGRHSSRPTSSNKPHIPDYRCNEEIHLDEANVRGILALALDDNKSSSSIIIPRQQRDISITGPQANIEVVDFRHVTENVNAYFHQVIGGIV